MLLGFSLCGGGAEELSRGVVSPCRDVCRHLVAEEAECGRCVQS